MSRLVSYVCVLIGIAAFCHSPGFLSRAQIGIRGAQEGSTLTEDEYSGDQELEHYSVDRPQVQYSVELADDLVLEMNPRTFEGARLFCGTDEYLLSRLQYETLASLHRHLGAQRLSVSSIWLNMKIIGGFFHWLDPFPGLVVDQIPLNNNTQGAADWNITHECAVLNVSTSRIETVDCDEKFPFVCVGWPVRTIMGATLIVSLTSNRSPILQSWEMKDLVLTCSARFSSGKELDRSLHLTAYAYVWTKNGIYLEEQELSIKPDIVSEINVVTHSNETSQGHYRCGWKYLPSGNTLWSNEITVVLRDFYTRRVTVTVPALEDDVHRWNIIGHSFADRANSTMSSILEELQQQQRLLHSQNSNMGSGLNKLSWSFFRTDPGSPDGRLLNISGFLYVKQEANAESGLDRRSLMLPDRLAKSGNVTLVDVVNCPPENGTRLQWTNYNHISAESSNPMCLTESYELIPRQCLINFTSEARWAPFDESRCVHLQQDPMVGKEEFRAICRNQTPCLVDVSTRRETWKVARDKCRSWNGYLASPAVLIESQIQGWSDITRKHGYVQSESSADDEALAALSRSEHWTSHTLSEGTHSSNPCFTVDLRSSRVVQSPCDNRLDMPCALPYKNGLLSLASCPQEGWLDLGSRSKCFWLNYTKATEDEASSICESHGGRLAVFQGKFAYATITAILVQPFVPVELDTFWINMMMVNKIVKLRSSNWDPSTDYNKTGGTLRVNRYVAERPLQVKWLTSQPWMRYPFICESPLVAGTPWLRIEVKQAGDSVTFTCHTSREILKGSIMWFKDGLGVRGNRIQPNSTSKTLTIPSATKNSPFLQGYYWCEGISIDGFREVESRKRLLRLAGLETFVGTIEVGKTANIPGLTDLSSQSFINFARNFQRVLMESENMRKVGSYILSEVKVLRLKQLRYNTHQVHFAMYHTKTNFKLRRQKRLSKKRDLEDEGVAESDMVTQLKDGLNMLSSVMEFNVIPGTAWVFSTRLCLASVTNHSTGFHPVLHWPATAVGDVVTSDEICIDDGNRPVVRRCEGNYTVGAYWGEVQGSCNVPPSQNTLDLRRLSRVFVTNDNALSTAEHLKALTSDSGSLLPQDISYAAKTIENTVSLQAITKEVSLNVISSISNIMNANATSLSLSRAANSTNKIIVSMEQMADNLQDHIIVFNGSIALGKIPARKYSTGLYLNTIEQQWHNFSEELTEGADVAIRFPKNSPCATDVENANVTLGLLIHNALFGNSFNGTSDVCTDVILVKYERCQVENSDEHFSFYFKNKCEHETMNETQLSVECVFWDVEADSNIGSWSREGCIYVGTVGKHHVCNCSHLTSFGILFKYRGETDGKTIHDTILSFFTLIGVALSIFGLLLVVATYALSEKWRKGVGHKCLLHLSISLLGSLVVFALLVMTHRMLRNSIACAAMGALMHYFLLVTFGWTFVEAILQYLRFVKVLGTYIPHFVLKCALPAWGIPLILVAAAISVDPQHYSSRRQLCWPDGRPLLYGFILPVGLTLVANVAVFSVVIYNIYCRRQKTLRSNQSQVKLAKAQLRATVCIVFLLGLTWILAYLSIIDAYGISRIFEYLFVVSATLQGFVIFIFHVVYEKTARKLWQSKLVYWISHRSGDIKGRRLHSDEGWSSTAQKTTST